MRSAGYLLCQEARRASSDLRLPLDLCPMTRHGIPSTLYHCSAAPKYYPNKILLLSNDADPVKKERAPRQKWGALEDQRAFLDELAHKLGSDPSQTDFWYKMRTKTIIENGGKGLLDHYKQSLSALLTKVYPEVSWDPLHFTKTPKKFWSSLENQRKFMDEIGIKLGIESGKESRGGWYKVSTQAVLDQGGRALLGQYDRSLSKLLSTVYPDFAWDPQLFTKSPQNYWSSLANQRKFLTEFAKKGGMKEGGEEAFWYTVSNKSLLENGGDSLLRRYQNSLPKLLQKVYPNINWKLWKFNRRISKTKIDPKVLNEIISEVEKVLGIKTPKDWHRVTSEQISELPYAKFLVSRKGVLLKALDERYAHEKWGEDASIATSPSTSPFK